MPKDLPIVLELDSPARSRCVLRRGPLQAQIRHIAENGTPWPSMVGQRATSLGLGRYQVGTMIVQVEPFLVPSYGCTERWEPILFRRR